MSVLTDTELQAALRVSRVTLWRLRKKYALPFFKVGGQYRYRTEDIERWLEETRYREVQLLLPLSQDEPLKETPSKGHRTRRAR